MLTPSSQSLFVLHPPHGALGDRKKGLVGRRVVPVCNLANALPHALPTTESVLPITFVLEVLDGYALCVDFRVELLPLPGVADDAELDAYLVHLLAVLLFHFAGEHFH